MNTLVSTFYITGLYDISLGVVSLPLLLYARNQSYYCIVTVDIMTETL